MSNVSLDLSGLSLKKTDVSLEEFVEQVAKKFFVSHETLLQFTNEYWGTDIKQMTIEDVIKSSKSSRASSVASTPRTTVSSSILMDQMDVLMLDTKKRKASTSTGPKLNKCKFILTSKSKNAGQVCGKPCVSEFCTTHTSSKSTNTTNKDKVTKDDCPPPVKRSMITKKAEKLPVQTSLDKFIEARVNTIKVGNMLIDNEKHLVSIGLQKQYVYNQAEDIFYAVLVNNKKVSLKEDDILYLRSLQVGYQLPSNLAEDDDGEESGNEVEKEEKSKDEQEDPSADYEDEDEDEEAE